MTTETEVLTPEVIIEKANAELITYDEGQALVAALSPIVPRLDEYTAFANSLTVTCKADADRAAITIAAINADVKTVLESIKAHKAEAKARHTLWTTFEKRFTDILDGAYDKARLVVKNWQDEENRKAAAEAARLQAIENERVRKEQERLRKEADKLKTPEKKQELIEQAESVCAHTVVVAPQKTKGMTFRTEVTVEITSIIEFIRDAAQRPDLCGYIDQDRLAAALKKAKQANKLFDCNGVKFGTKTV